MSAASTRPVVVLVGPPGAGKTTTGTRLAALLGVALLDTDAAVEAAAGATVSEVFLSRGEPEFRALEERAVADALRTHPGVLALGGGAVLSARTRAALAGHRVVLLDVGAAEGVHRTGLGGARPLLAGVNPRATYRALLAARAPLYAEVATARVVTDGRDPDDVVTEVAALLGTGAGTGTAPARTAPDQPTPAPEDVP
ncbi:hypothetical protein GCM10027047_24950 [Rhodococcus aerolatus]